MFVTNFEERDIKATRTALETTFRIVPWAVRRPARIYSWSIDVVPLLLVPDHYLLRSLYTLG